MPDFKQPIILDTDASNFEIGSVLSKRIDGKERPIAYANFNFANFAYANFNKGCETILFHQKRTACSCTLLYIL